ncbi:Protein of unknown function [Gryllus bimaculatus]|nr:Protein of unknown function [Gryllus bimaculatus]
MYVGGAPAHAAPSSAAAAAAAAVAAAAAAMDMQPMDAVCDPSRKRKSSYKCVMSVKNLPSGLMPEET